METKVTHRKDKLILDFIGECCIESAGKMRTAILEAISCSGNVTLNLKRITAVDICLFQLLCSAHRSALNSGKLFSLAAARSEVFTWAAKRMGYTRTIGCHEDPLKDCLWVEVQK